MHIDRTHVSEYIATATVKCIRTCSQIISKEHFPFNFFQVNELLTSRILLTMTSCGLRDWLPYYLSELYFKRIN